MPSSPAISRTRLSISPAGALTMDRARAMFSKAVRVSSRLQSWKMKPSRSRRNFASSLPFNFVSSRPSMTMEPEVGRSMVDTQLRRVVLPDPEGPITPTNSPASRDRDTPSRARVTAPPFPYTRLRPVTVRISFIMVLLLWVNFSLSFLYQGASRTPPPTHRLR